MSNKQLETAALEIVVNDYNDQILAISRQLAEERALLAAAKVDWNEAKELDLGSEKTVKAGPKSNKKASTKKKSVGRPRKLSSEKKTSTKAKHATEETPPVKRRRGRPKGSTNKKKKAVVKQLPPVVIEEKARLPKRKSIAEQKQVVERPLAVQKEEVKDFIYKLKQVTVMAVKSLYDVDIDASQITLQDTRKEFEGNITLLTFPFTRQARKKPEQIGAELGSFLERGLPFVTGHNVIKGFLNLSISDSTWVDSLKAMQSNDHFGKQASNGEIVVLEYCGPNTNKPLHIGHLRNMVLGYSMAEILKANGYQVHKVNILNDRGLAICKSMVAYMNEGEGKTPESEGVKGDHFVGDYYVRFGKMYKEELSELVAAGADLVSAEKNSKLMQQARELLRKWEADDLETRTLWARMNSWVYKGYEETYATLGVDFERDYYESETYEYGKEIAQQGLEAGVFTKDEDGSLFVDLSEHNMDPKRILRSDGTSLYFTQDLGTAEMRYAHYGMDKSIYVVGDEQNLHFKQLQIVLEKLGKDYAKGIYHLSYGMVHLPGNVRMRTREGAMVDADDLMREVVERAAEATKESGKLSNFSEEESQALYHDLGLAALKYFMLNVNAKKKMTFDPAESVSLQGRSAIFLMFSYVRTRSVMRKFGKAIDPNFKVKSIEPIEQELIQLLYKTPFVVQDSAKTYDPSLIANHIYDVAKTFNRFWTACQVLNNKDQNLDHFRMSLAEVTGNVLKLGMNLLGIQTTERM